MPPKDNTDQKHPLLESISPIGLCLIYLTFLFAVGLSLLFSAIIPQPYRETYAGTWNCTEDDISEYNDTLCYSPNLISDSINEEITGTYRLGPFSSLNREFRVTGIFSNVLELGEIKRNIKLRMSVLGLSDDEQTTTIIESRKTVEVTVDCISGEDYCNSFLLYTEPYISYSNYLIVLTITESSLTTTDIGQLYLILSTVPMSYTYFELCWIIVFIIFSCFIFIAFMFLHRRKSYKQWTYEIKWTFILLIGLLFQNNPIYAYDYAFGLFMFSFYNTTVTSAFCILLLLYILITFDYYRKGKGTKKLKYWIPRTIFFMLFFLSVLVLMVYNQSIGLVDPYYEALRDIPNIVLAVIALGFIILYVFWLLFCLVRACSEGKKLGKTKRKLRIFGVLTMVSLALYLMLILLIFFYGYQETAPIYLTSIAYVNFFCAILVLLLLPTTHKESQIWSDNRLKITALDDQAVYKQLPDDITTDLDYEGVDDEYVGGQEEIELTDTNNNERNNTGNQNTNIPYDGSEAIEL
ncbi:Wntless-like transmembrane domain-containing protein [Entamoeba marina]